jgi:hypothetical protein
MSVLGLAKMLYEAMKVVISTKQMRTFHKVSASSSFYSGLTIEDLSDSNSTT